MESKMEQIITKMAEYICDDLCIYPKTETGEKLEGICADCDMGDYVCQILNEYNRINESNKGAI